MTRKDKILQFIAKLPEDVSYDRVIYHLDVMRAIEQGMDDLRHGRVIDHDELFDRLLSEDAKNQDHVDRAGRARPAANPVVRQERSKSKDGGRTRKAAPKRSPKT
jgi:hypothetical protein